MFLKLLDQILINKMTKRKFNFLNEIPVKGDAEALLSLADVRNRLDYLYDYSTTLVSSLKSGNALFSRFTEFRSIVAACFNTTYMEQIESKLKSIYPVEYETTGTILPMTIKAYLIGYTAIVSGGPARYNLPISIGSIPKYRETVELPTENIYLYNNSTLTSMNEKDESNFTYIYTSINKLNPTLSDFNGFDKSDIVSLKEAGITEVELWAYKNGTIYTKLFEGNIDDLKIKSNTTVMVIVGIAIFLIVLIILLLIFSNKGQDSKF